MASVASLREADSFAVEVGDAKILVEPCRVTLPQDASQSKRRISPPWSSTFSTLANLTTEA
jgi:hypothetical protein